MEQSDEIEQLNLDLEQLQDRLFSTRKQAVDLISKILDEYELDYDFSDVTEYDNEVFYTIETPSGQSVYFHLIFVPDKRAGTVAAYAQIIDEDAVNDLLMLDYGGSLGDQSAVSTVEPWTTSPYLRQTRRSDDSG